MKKILEGKILTIPNLLSCLRLALIPCFVWQFLVRDDRIATMILLLVSGLTDVADGFIARRFDMVSDLGKVLDPLADKLTQAAMLVCLTGSYPMMLLPFGLMVVKEMVCVGTGLAAIDSSGDVKSADWHGKLATVLLYGMLITHVLWLDIPAGVSLALILLCAAVIVLSGTLYGVRNLREIRRFRQEAPEQEEQQPPAA
ncbi:MAG: CDP-alcohol phosphatidyltransferase family protein [Oscillospiraceae bacterium]|nr:CDP-alcohol phosphatidyltransferase family protein [Oscillospiraceae bacterium]